MSFDSECHVMLQDDDQNYHFILAILHKDICNFVMHAKSSRVATKCTQINDAPRVALTENLQMHVPTQKCMQPQGLTLDSLV